MGEAGGALNNHCQSQDLSANPKNTQTCCATERARRNYKYPGRISNSGSQSAGRSCDCLDVWSGQVWLQPLQSARGHRGHRSAGNSSGPPLLFCVVSARWTCAAVSETLVHDESIIICCAVRRASMAGDDLALK